MYIGFVDISYISCAPKSKISLKFAERYEISVLLTYERINHW